MQAGDRVYATLREEILDGALVPGTVLAEVEQATRLGVSRTPVRAAFTRLRADGLLTAQSPRVLVVTELTADRVRALYELRSALEASAASLAARRRDPAPFRILRDRLAMAGALLDEPEGRERYFEVVDDLDEAIERAADNTYLTAALASVRLHSARVRRLSRFDDDRLRRAAEEHGLVVEAILAADPELAADATRIHLAQSQRSALERMSHDHGPAPVPAVSERTSA